MKKKIEKLLKKIKEMNEHKVEFNTQVAIIKTELKIMLENNEIKTDKDEFIAKIEKELKYSFYKIHEFADEHLQNLNTLNQNIRDFKKWIGEEK